MHHFLPYGFRRPRPGHHSWTRASTHPTPFGSDASIVSSLDRMYLYGSVPFSGAAPWHLRALMHFLASATPVPPDQIPPDLVTMNSVIHVRDLAAGTRERIELVYPFDSDRIPLGRSIAAPLGAAVFGRRVGDRVTWRHRTGVRHIAIEGLHYQPEREGHYHR